jgi:predicted Zn-dependent protease
LLAPAGRAPRAELDAALFVSHEFFGVQAHIPRPYAEARPAIATLESRYPNDPRLALRGAQLDARLGAVDRAAVGMERYATLEGRKPNALRRLAAFYRDQLRTADEVRVLDEAASKLPARERAPLYRRAIAAIEATRPANLQASTYYEKLIDADPDGVAALHDYVSLLLRSGDTIRAVNAVDRAERAPGERTISVRRSLLAERARIYDQTGRRKEALDVYTRAYDPLWPRAIAADYYALLGRYGMYRGERRKLQAASARADASLTTVARLFNFYAFEGSHAAAVRLLAAYEKAHPQGWSLADLELAAALSAQVGDYDAAARYLFSLYLGGGFANGSPEREAVLARLFSVLVEAENTPTRLAPGGLAFYRDIAQLDRRPGAANALLSLILAGNNPVSEFAREEARAGGYLNRALAWTIYEQFVGEYPASSRLGAMTVALLGALEDYQANDKIVSVGTHFMAAHANAREYDAVALAVADAHVRRRDRAAERQILRDLLDRAAARQPADRPLLDRDGSRWVYQPDPGESMTGDEGDADAPPRLVVAPNGAVMERSWEFDRFFDDSPASYSVVDPTASNTPASSGYVDTPYDYLGREEHEIQRSQYVDLLERMVASYEADKARGDLLAFFWSEVRKHPRDEGLLERFLGWLGSTSLLNDQLQAYQMALKQYDDGTWLHRFARWYVRRGRGAEVRRLTEQVIRTLDDEQVAEYLRQFAGYGGAARGDSLDWNNLVALQVTLLAHQRFPNNLEFVEQLLGRYAANEDWVAWERLAREYYFLSPSIRDKLLARLSATNKLETSYALARRRATSLEGGVTPAFAYAVFSADAARWLSHFDDAVAAYRKLADLYPGERDYAEPLAALLRSLAARDPRLYAEAAAVLDKMAALHPTDHRYPTEAGEVLAEAGDLNGAAVRWKLLAEREPGSPGVHLEVATILWDYFQFDAAAAELEALQATAHDESLYAYRLGAVYDSKGDLDRAIPEYVRSLAQAGTERENARVRLAEIYDRAGAKIQNAYEHEHLARRDDWQLVLGYADLLRDVGLTGDAVAVLNREVEASSEVAFVEEARSRFELWSSRESELRAMKRLVDIARDEREAIRARLQLADMYEKQRREADAAAAFDSLVADYPTNAGVLEEAGQYFWRVGRREHAVEIYRATIAKAEGEFRKRFVRQLARKQSDAGQFAEAELTLRALYTSGPLDLELFADLAGVLGKAKRHEALAELYKDALGRVRTAGLDDVAERAQLEQLRTGMIATLDGLKRYQDAVDQYIEIINKDPENTVILDAAYEYAARHELLPRLGGYYEKLATESFKDYRWSLVLARILDRSGNVTGAVEAYRRAVANEPQRIDLRGSLADSLVRAGRAEDAVAELRRAWELDGRNPDWLVRVARIRATEGRFDDAGAVIDEAMAAMRRPSPARLGYFAGLLAEWGMLDKSAQVYDRALDTAAADLENSDLGSAALDGYVQVATRVRPPAAVLARMLSYHDSLAAQASRTGNLWAGKASALRGEVETTIKSSLGRISREYGSPDELRTLESELRRLMRGAPGDRLLTCLAVAEGAGLYGAEEAARLELLERTLTMAGTPRDRGRELHTRLEELVEMCHRYGLYEKAARHIEAWRRRDPMAGEWDYDRRLAENFKLAGNTQEEMAALERVYEAAGATGAVEGDADSAVERLFTLLLQRGHRDGLARLANKQSPHQLALINFLIAHGEEDLARAAIEHTGFSRAWIDARTAQLGLYFRNASPAVEAAFKGVLELRPIGELVDREKDVDATLAGGDYFLTARNYGAWLDLVAGRPDQAADYLVGRVEQRPRDAAAQAELARYYLARGRSEQAFLHSELALELGPRDREAVVVRGRVLAASGRTDDAVTVWTALVQRKDASIEDLRAYFAEMSGHGRLAPALESLTDTIIDRTSRGRFGEVEPLLGDFAEYGRANNAVWPAIADALYHCALETPSDLRISRTIIYEQLLPAERCGPFYRLVTDRLESQAAAVAADPDSSGYYDGEEWVDPIADLNEWRKRNVDYLLRRGNLEAAQALVESITRERIDQTGRLADSDESRDYRWVDLARIALDTSFTGSSRARHLESALVAANRYAAPSLVDDGLLPDRGRAYEAADLLRRGGATAEADAFLEKILRELIDARSFDDENFIGLAEVLYRRGNAEAGDATLRRMAVRSSDNATSLRLAAAAAGRAGRYSLAIELRETAARLAPAHIGNLLELARLRAASGDGARAAGELGRSIADETAPNWARAQAVDVALAIAMKNGEARDVLLKQPAKSEAGRVLAARLAGDQEALSGFAEESALAALHSGRLLLETGRKPEALAAFVKAVAMDPNGAVTGVSAVGGPMPPDALVALLAQQQRQYAVLVIAMRHASRYQSDEDESAGGFLFTPRPAPQVAVAGLGTLDEENAAASSAARSASLATMVDVAANLELWEEALGYARARVATTPPASTERSLAEARVTDLLAAQRAAARRREALLQLGDAIADERLLVKEFTL